MLSKSLIEDDGGRAGAWQIPHVVAAFVFISTLILWHTYVKHPDAMVFHNVNNTSILRDMIGIMVGLDICRLKALHIVSIWRQKQHNFRLKRWHVWCELLKLCHHMGDLPSARPPAIVFYQCFWQHFIIKMMYFIRKTAPRRGGL